MATIQITEMVARKVIETVDAGLVGGLGSPTPGQMCVEAAVCYALGLPHGDDPPCVSPLLRSLKIRLNDSSWSSKKARARGLRRLAVSQLGSLNELDEREFARRLIDCAIRVSTPKALRIAAELIINPFHRDALRSAANKCEMEGTADAAYAAACAACAADDAVHAAAYAADAARAAARAADAAYAAACAADAAYDAADAAARAAAHAADAATGDQALEEYAELVVQILIEMKAPGCQWLFLTEEA